MARPRTAGYGRGGGAGSTTAARPTVDRGVSGCSTAGLTLTKQVMHAGYQLAGWAVRELGRGLEPTRFNTFLSQGHPIAPGCFAVFLRALAIESRGSTLRPVVAVFTIGSQELGLVEVVLTPVGSTVTTIGDGVPLVSGCQDLLGGPQALGKHCLPGLQRCQPPFEAGRSFIGYPIEWHRPQHGGYNCSPRALLPH